MNLPINDSHIRPGRSGNSADNRRINPGKTKATQSSWPYTFLFLSALVFLITGCGGGSSSKSSSSGSSGSGSGVILTGERFYLSATGSGTACTESNPCGTFEDAFNAMSEGDILIVDDGTYDQSMGNMSSNPPSGTASNPTDILARNDGGVTITQDININNSYINVEGFRFVSPASASHLGSIAGDNINLRRTSFHQTNTIGSGMRIAGTNVLIEDVWISGVGKQAYSAGSGANNDDTLGHHITFRRVVMSLKNFTGTDGGFLGIILYGAKDIVVENMIVIDYGNISLTAGEEHAGIRSRVGWGAHSHAFFGSLVLNVPFDGYRMTLGGCENCIAWDTGERGFNQSNSSSSTNGMELNKITVGNASTGVDKTSHIYTNTLIYESGASSFLGNNNYNHLFNAGGTTSGSQDITSNPGIKHITRVESGAPGYGTGLNGQNRGADLLYQYVNGEETSDPLWPWPYEDRIKKEMCTDVGVTDGWCASGNGLYGGEITLTSYIWEYVGTACPSDVCDY